MKVSYKEREEYSRMLKEKRRELGFKNSELAEYIGVSLITAGKYISGESYPASEKTREKINEFLESLSTIDNFHRLGTKEFSELLARLISVFNISQTEIAEETGIKQPYINDYLSGGKGRRISAKTQYDILSFFLYKSHLGTGVFLPEYLETGQELMEILGVKGLRKNPPAVFEYSVERIGDESYLHDESESLASRIKMKNRESLEYFSKLPLEIKKIIKETEEAFFLYTDVRDMSIGLDIHDYLSDIKFLNDFDDRIVPETLGNIHAKKLSPDTDNKKFKAICGFFKLMSVADTFPSLIAKKTRRCAEDDKLDLWYRATLSSQFSVEPFTDILLKLRLEMTAMDWYYVMLAYINSGEEEKILNVNNIAYYIRKLYEI